MQVCGADYSLLQPRCWQAGISPEGYSGLSFLNPQSLHESVTHAGFVLSSLSGNILMMAHTA